LSESQVVFFVVPPPETRTDILHRVDKGPGIWGL